MCQLRLRVLFKHCSLLAPLPLCNPRQRHSPDLALQSRCVGKLSMKGPLALGELFGVEKGQRWRGGMLPYWVREGCCTTPCLLIRTRRSPRASSPSRTQRQR